MYITYETRQWSDHDEAEEGIRVVLMEDRQYDQPPKKLPAQPPKTEFMPTKLVRISDMQVVPGATVNEGYCALSYSWGQSGDIVLDPATGKSKRDDKGYHKIIFPSRNPIAKIFPALRPKSFVQFEGIIKRISNDFNIRYIWFDQMCIDQDNKEERRREIRQMHRVYSNAYCTLVLVPEVRVYLRRRKWIRWKFQKPDLQGSLLDQGIHMSNWQTRMWTLEEALLSKRLLFVGQNVHTWWYKVRNRHSVAYDLCQDPGEFKVNTVLSQAHSRETTKEHDRIFALANIFSDIVDDIAVDYEQPVLDLMIDFYGRLAKKDISILCFGGGWDVNIFYPEYGTRTKDDKEDSIRKYDLPSWTGSAGYHENDNTLKTHFRNYKVTGRFMQVTSTAITNDQFSSNYPFTLSLDDLLPWPIGRDAGLYVSVKTPEHSGIKIIAITGSSSPARGHGITSESSDKVKKEVQEDVLGYASRMFRAVSQIMPVKKEDLFWADRELSHSEYSVFHFELTELDRFGPYIILSGIPFDFDSSIEEPCHGKRWYPVIRKSGDRYYKAIGRCLIRGTDHFFSDYNSAPEQTFIIQ